MANNTAQGNDHSGDRRRRLRRYQLQSRCDHCKKLGHTVDQCFELIRYPADWRRKNSGLNSGVRIDKHKFNPTVSQAEAKENESETALVHNQTWDALNLDTLQKIFDLIPSNELVWNIPLVCRSWRLVFWDKLFWSKDGCCLDLTPAAPFPSCTDDGYKDLSNILGSIFYGNYDDSDAYGHSLSKWRNSINRIRFPVGLERHHKLLKNLSDWIPNVVSLELVGSGASKISQKGFRMVARRYCFKSLTKMHLGELNYPNYAAFFNAFSEKKGRRFEELHISQKEFTLTKKLAYKMIPGVHSFKKVFFMGAHLYEAGLWRLLRPVRDNPWLFRRFEFHKCVFMDFYRPPEYYFEQSDCYHYPFSKPIYPPDIHYSPSKLCFERSEGLYKWWIIDDDED